MPQFHVTGRDVFKGQPWQAIIEADSADAARSFVGSRNIQPATVTPCDSPAALAALEASAPGLLRMRVPAADAALPPTPLARRFRLVALGIGIALFLISGFLFVNRAKEHLLREKQVPPQPQGLPQPQSQPQPRP